MLFIHNMKTEYYNKIKNGKVAIIDFGKTKATITDLQGNLDTSKASVIQGTKQEILEIASKLKDYFIGAEDSHLGVPNLGESEAQGFKPDTLLKFYNDCENNNNSIGLLPQNFMPNASAYSQLKKDDLNDGKAWAKWLIDNPQTSVKNRVKSFDLSPKREAAFKMKKELDHHLNHARVKNNCIGQQAYNMPDSPTLKFIAEHKEEIYSRCQPKTNEIFDITLNEKDGKVKLYTSKTCKDFAIKMSQVYSVVACLYGKFNKETKTFSSEPVFREHENTLPTWKYAKRYLLGFTPFHTKAGVAASNIKWWGRKSYIKAQAKKIEDLYYIHNSVDKVDKEGNPKQSKITVFDSDKNRKSVSKPNGGDQTGLRGDFARRNKDYDQFFLEKRREYDAAVKDLFNVVRSIVVEKYNV